MGYFEITTIGVSLVHGTVVSECGSMAEILLPILLPRQRARPGVVLPCLGHQETRLVVPNTFDGDRDRNLVAELENTLR